MKREEDALQRLCCDWLRILEAQGKLTFFHVPNGGKRSKIEAAIMKGMGVRAGVGDLVIVLPPYGRLAMVELKAPGKRPTGSQEDFGTLIDGLGGMWFWCDTFEAFERQVLQWIEIEQARAEIARKVAVDIIAKSGEFRA